MVVVQPAQSRAAGAPFTIFQLFAKGTQSANPGVRGTAFEGLRTQTVIAAFRRPADLESDPMTGSAQRPRVVSLTRAQKFDGF